MTFHSLRAAAAVISVIGTIAVTASLLGAGAALAGEGHDHDHGPASPAAAGPALPRFAATSELFELVGVLNGRQLTLYLDRAADNAPVTEAQIELELAGTPLQVERHGDVFEARLAAEPAPGVLPVTATVRAGADVDLLAAELDLHEAAPADEHAHGRPWPVYAGAAVAAAAVLGALAFAGRRLAAARQRRTQEAA